MAPKHFDPLIFPPLNPQHHTHTLIILHGRGSNAKRFGPTLLETSHLQERLPTAKFIFPTALSRRSTILKKVRIHQWLDNFSLEDPNLRPDLQYDGLEESARYLRELVRVEVGLLDGDLSKVVIGGLSQGCAASLFAVLGGGFGSNGHEERLGGWFGMSGWLPMQKDLEEILISDRRDQISEEREASERSDSEGSEDESDSHDDGGEDDTYPEVSFSDEEENGSDDDPFSAAIVEHDFNDVGFSDDEDTDLKGSEAITTTTSDEHAHYEQNPITKAVNHIRDILDLPPLESSATDLLASTTEIPKPSHLQIPFFLGHGTADPKVSVQLCHVAARTLQAGFQNDNVTVRTYEDFGHWYKVPDEIDDLLLWLEKEVGVVSVPLESEVIAPDCNEPQL